MRVIAIWVTYIVLHVADDGIVPICEVHGSIRREDRIRRPEILVTTHEQAARLVERRRTIRIDCRDGKIIPCGLAPNSSGIGIAFEMIVFDTEEADHVADEKVALHGIGKVSATDNFTGSHRTNFLLQEFVHLEPVSFRTHLIRFAAGTIRCVVVPPRVKSDSVRVG